MQNFSPYETTGVVWCESNWCFRQPVLFRLLTTKNGRPNVLEKKFVFELQLSTFSSILVSQVVDFHVAEELLKYKQKDITDYKEYWKWKSKRIFGLEFPESHFILTGSVTFIV